MKGAGSVRAVLFKSVKRFDSFHTSLRDVGADVTVLDFDQPDWIDFDFDDVDIVIYFPSFEFTSNHPQALTRVTDNLMHIHRLYPHIQMFPCPNVIPYYSDKYRQWLFMRSRGLPTPETYPMYTEQSLDGIARRLGFPLVVKNRFGAGGAYVYKVETRDQLQHLYRQSQLDLLRSRAIWGFAGTLTNRTFYRRLIRQRRMEYPFPSPPLLAQSFVPHERDMRVVMCGDTVIEANWRRSANPQTWKVNVDSGGIAEWSYVPPEAIELSKRLSGDLKASWLKIDIVEHERRWMIFEFSPAWHHFVYAELPSFVYKEDYNIAVPLDTAQHLETLIVESLVRSAAARVVSPSTSPKP